MAGAASFSGRRVEQGRGEGREGKPGERME